MARAYRCRPSQLFGINEPGDEWLAYMVDRATYYWGSFIESKIKETKRVPAPPNRHERPMIEVPKYTAEQIHMMIYDEPTERPTSDQATTADVPMNPYAVAPEPDHVPERFRDQGDVIQQLVRMKP